MATVGDDRRGDVEGSHHVDVQPLVQVALPRLLGVAGPEMVGGIPALLGFLDALVISSKDRTVAAIVF